MYLMKKSAIGVFFAAVLLVVGLSSCEKSKDDNGGGGSDEALHLSFKTPDWERRIDCTHLDLQPLNLNDSTYYVSATSQSTSETFFFSYPKDSSELVKTGNLKKYRIREFGDNDGGFEFSQKLPVTEGSSDRLISAEGFSAAEYNEVLAVTHVGTDGNYALFQIRCRYEMRASVNLDMSNMKTVSGTFHFKVRARRQ